MGRWLGRSFASLGFSEFRCLWLGVVLGNCARWAFVLGLGWMVYQVTRSSLWVGAAVMGTQAPALLVAPLAGAWADRWPRRRLLLLGFLMAAGASGLLALASLRGEAPVGVVMAASVLFGSAFAVKSTAWNSILPNCVPPQHLVNAVSLQSMAYHGSQFAGPALAGPVLLLLGAPGTFGVALALYLAGAATALWLRPPEQGPSRASSAGMWVLTVEGIRYLRASPLVGGLMTMIGLHCGLTMTYMGLLPHFAVSALAGGETAYSALMMAVGLGAVTATLALAGSGYTQHRTVAYLWSTLVSGLSLVGLAAAGKMPWPLAWALGMAALVGGSQAMFMALSQVWTVGLADDRYRGRVASVYNMLATGAMALGNWAFGALAQRLAPAPVLAAMGVAFVATCAVMALRSVPLRELWLSRFDPQAAGGPGHRPVGAAASHPGPVAG